MWSDIGSLKILSQSLMWASAVFAVLAATTTGIRYYVDRRVSELTSLARNEEQQKLESEQKAREGALRAKVEEAEREQREANAKLLKLEKNSKPRHLTDAQIQVVKAAILGCPKKHVVFTASMGDAEARAFAEQIETIFKSAGWTSDGVELAVFTGTPIGIIIRVPNKTDVHPCIVPIQTAFGQIGFSAPAEVINTTKPDILDIVIGHKKSDD